MEDIAYIGLLEDEAIELDVAALRIAAPDHPGIDLTPYTELLGTLAEELSETAGYRTDTAGQAAALSGVLAGDHGFVGDTHHYDDPANADLIRVIDRRRGLPVSLSILYVAAARRIGWTADPLDTPGHVLIRLGHGRDAAILDPFARGRLADGVPAGTGGKLPALSNRATLVRLLANQATRADAGGERARALAVYTRMTVIAPGHAAGWWERGRLELAQGDTTAARTSLAAILEATRDPLLRARANAALAAIPAA